MTPSPKSDISTTWTYLTWKPTSGRKLSFCQLVSYFSYLFDCFDISIWLFWLISLMVVSHWLFWHFDLIVLIDFFDCFLWLFWHFDLIVLIDCCQSLIVLTFRFDCFDCWLWLLSVIDSFDISISFLKSKNCRNFTTSKIWLLHTCWSFLLNNLHTKTNLNI